MAKSELEKDATKWVEYTSSYLLGLLCNILFCNNVQEIKHGVIWTVILGVVLLAGNEAIILLKRRYNEHKGTRSRKSNSQSGE